VNIKTLLQVISLFSTALLANAAAAADTPPYKFNVLLQRSVALTAQYWNPILIYVSKRSGAELELKLARTVKEGNALTEQGAFDFIYTNHFFTPERDRMGFRVIARPAGRGIQGQLVVARDSPIKTLEDLTGRDVAFPSPNAFAAYWLPMDALIKAKINVKPVFTSNQEASLAQLKVGTIAAAAVNDQLVQRYARREQFAYRTLWSSEIFKDLCIMVSPGVPKEKVAAVRDALINMMHDAEGRKILEAGAELLKIDDKLGFIAADNRDYEQYRAFYKNTPVRAVP
jgi:phosphonate transport system substrate-binding protein